MRHFEQFLNIFYLMPLERNSGSEPLPPIRNSAPDRADPGNGGEAGEAQKADPEGRNGEPLVGLKRLKIIFIMIRFLFWQKSD